MAQAEMQPVQIPYRPRKLQYACHQAVSKHRFSVIVAHRGFGKTILAVNQLVLAATNGPTNGVYGYIAPFRQQAKSIAWDYLKRYTAPIIGRTTNEAELSVTLPEPCGAKIGIYGADNPDALRGIHWDGIVPDEVAQMKPQVWGEILRPGLTARKGWALFIGTPKGQNLFFELYQQALSTEGWYAGFFPVNETGLFGESELVLARSSMTEAQFNQEYMCDFSAACEDVLIRLDMVQAAATRKYGNHEFANQPRVMGVDIARFGDDKSCIIKRQGKAVWPAIKLTGMASETLALAGKIATEIKTFEPAAVFIDSGYNPGVIDLLRSWGHTVTEVAFGGAPTDSYYLNKRAEMWGLMRDWLATGAIPDDAELKGELIAPTYDFGGRGGSLRLESKEDMKKRGLHSPNVADALALTFAAPVVMAPSGTKQYQNTQYDEAEAYDPFHEYSRPAHARAY